MNIATPLNAFSSITIRDLITDKNGRSYPETFHKGIIKPGKQLSMKSNSIMRANGIPTRPVSSLPPPGDEHLTLTLGEMLGDGRVGSVYAVNFRKDGLAKGLPPLVIKVSHRKRYANVAQEAWFYEELEQLQGIAVPRCYGFFQARLDDPQDASVTWDKDENEYDSEDQDEDDNEEHEGGYEDEDEPLDDHEKEIIEQLTDDRARFKAIDRGYEEQLTQRLPGEGPVLSILLLERLDSGGRIPVKEAIDAIKTDVSEIFNDLARLGIDPLDIRWSNILSVNDKLKTALPGEICPNHGHVHRWRLVDFDHCRKTDGTTEYINRSNRLWLNRLFSNLEKGRVC